jgi:hypothetical protein
VLAFMAAIAPVLALLAGIAVAAVSISWVLTKVSWPGQGE